MANILVVDDDADILDLVRSVLEPQHTVFTAKGGSEAIELLSRQEMDLMVTDVRMPGMNGFTLVSEAKALRPRMNVIIMSAYIDDSDEVACQVLRRYTDIALSKPLHAGQIRELVDVALDS